ncbi:hypothetical protein AYI69_g10797 [Smittium culicis]|uniref:Uncharacterized protein n=1 Tax=Smittium culicis TaxID=133412 RepID=A0A1R1X3C3_9FUNG|nr:hypothetical protein AYI69_g10797 [Smittium culicis]
MFQSFVFQRCYFLVYGIFGSLGIVELHFFVGCFGAGCLPLIEDMDWNTSLCFQSCLHNQILFSSLTSVVP